MAVEAGRYLGISEAAESTGFSLDTLRWYEREGLFPRVERDSSRRRRYSPRDVALLRTLARLRRAGMPTKEMREFTRLTTEGAATHGSGSRCWPRIRSGSWPGWPSCRMTWPCWRRRSSTTGT